MKIRKSSVLLQYIVTSLIVLLIPVIVIIGSIYYNVIHTVENEVQESNEQILSQVRNIVDMRMRDIEQISISISSNMYLTPYVLKNGGYDTYLATRELKNYKSANSFIQDMIIHINENDFFYSDTGSFALNSFLSQIYSNKNWSKDDFSKEINNLNTPLIRPLEEVGYKGVKTNLITYIYPLLPGHTKPYGQVIFLIDKSVFGSLIDGVFDNYKGNVFILDEKSRILASSGNDGLVLKTDPAVFAKSTGGNGNSIYTIELNGIDYSVSKINSEYNRWTYITVMPTSQFFYKVIKMRFIIIQAAVFVLLLGISLAIFSAFFNYRPITKVTGLISKKLSSRENIDISGNEIDLITRAIDTVADINDELSTKLEYQKPFLRDQMLRYIIDGINQDQWDRMKALSGIYLSGRNFSSIIIMPSSTFPVQSVRSYKIQMRMIAEEFSQPNLFVYGVELVHEYGVACIINSDIKDDLNLLLEGLASRIQRKIEEEMGFKVVVGIGCIYDNVGSVHKAFIEASASLDCKLTKGQNGIIFFEEIARLPAEGKEASYPLEESVLLVQGIKQGDIATVLDTVQRIISYIEQGNMKQYMAKCIVFDVINTVMKAAESMKISLDLLLENQRDIVSDVESGTIKELHESLNRLCLRICEKVCESKESKNTKLRDDIIRYIRSNYRNGNLSIEGIAYTFDMSRAYLSRFFKDQTGSTPNDFINNLRLNDIKGMLVSTDKPVKDIICEVGFIDTASFSRKFKREEGITPGQYRELNRKPIRKEII